MLTLCSSKIPLPLYPETITKVGNLYLLHLAMCKRQCDKNARESKKMLYLKHFSHSSEHCEVFQEISVNASVRGQFTGKRMKFQGCQNAHLLSPSLASHDTKDSSPQCPCSKGKCEIWQGGKKSRGY